MVRRFHLHPPKRRAKAFVRLNNNLLNYPLARDRHTKGLWTLSERGWWWCDLPGQREVRFRVPKDVTPRLPDAFDVAVLFALFRYCRMRENREVTFAGLATLLQELGVPDHSRYRRRLKQALELWSQLTIHWKKWYSEARYRAQAGDWVVVYVRPRKVKVHDAKRIKRTLPPPIESLCLRPLRVVIAEPWLEQTKFQSRVDLPLPLKAAVQNLVLAILANRNAKRSMRAWCRTVGLNHTTRNKQFLKVVAEADQWFRQHKGFAICLTHMDGVVWFIRMDPRELDDEGVISHEETGQVSGADGSYLMGQTGQVS